MELILVILDGLLVLYVLDHLPLFYFLGRIRHVINYTILYNMQGRVKSWVYWIRRHFHSWICLSFVALSAYWAEKCFGRKSSIFNNLSSLLLSFSFRVQKRLVVDLFHIRAFDCPCQDLFVFSLFQSVLVLNLTWTKSQLIILSLHVFAHFLRLQWKLGTPFLSSKVEILLRDQLVTFLHCLFTSPVFSFRHHLWSKVNTPVRMVSWLKNWGWMSINRLLCQWPSIIWIHL